MAGLPLEDEVAAPSRPVVNNALIAVNIAVFFIGITAPSLLYPGARDYGDVLQALGMVPYHIVRGEKLYTLVTSMFLHANLVHLLGNMLFLHIFGDNVEAVMGRWRYLAFYFAAGFAATLFHLTSIALIPPSGLVSRYEYSPWLVPAVGASGAISGILGAYLVLYPGAMLRAVFFWGFIPIFYRIPAAIYIAFWFAYQLLMGIFSLTGLAATGVAFWAHIGGFIAGIAMLPLFVDRKLLRYYRRAAWRSEYGFGGYDYE